MCLLKIPTVIHVLPSARFPKNNIESIPKGVALRLTRICDSDKNYLIAREKVIFRY